MGRRDNWASHLGDPTGPTFGHIGVWALRADVRRRGRAVVIGADCANFVNERKYTITAGNTGMRRSAGFVKQRFTG